MTRPTLSAGLAIKNLTLARELARRSEDNFDCTSRFTINNPCLHHQFHLAQGLDVVGWVSLNSDQVRQKA